MIITVANFEEGVGKTTFTKLFSNYIFEELKKKVCVIDFDLKGGLFKQYKLDKEQGKPIRFDVEFINEKNFDYTQNSKILDKMNTSSEVFIFDTSNEQVGMYVELFKNSNYIIIPYNYSPSSQEGTFLLLNGLIKFIETTAKIIFLFNDVKNETEYKFQSLLKKELMKVGVVCEGKIEFNEELKNVNTAEINYNQKIIVKETFNELIYNIWE